MDGYLQMMRYYQQLEDNKKELFLLRERDTMHEQDKERALKTQAIKHDREMDYMKSEHLRNLDTRDRRITELETKLEVIQLDKDQLEDSVARLKKTEELYHESEAALGKLRDENKEMEEKIKSLTEAQESQDQLMKQIKENLCTMR